MVREIRVFSLSVFIRTTIRQSLRSLRKNFSFEISNLKFAISSDFAINDFASSSAFLGSGGRARFIHSPARTQKTPAAERPAFTSIPLDS
jgi:hypothetical protein